MIPRLGTVALLLLLAACAGRPAPPPAAASPSAGRLVSLAPNLTETLYALGAGSRLVAATDNDHYPPQVEQLPRVGGMQPDYERLVALRPDLVLLDRNLNDPEIQERLEGLGLELLVLETRTLDDLRRTLPRLGQALGVEERAARALADLEAGLAEVERGAAALPHHPRVFVEIWGEPLMTAGRGSLVHELVERAGGRNLYGDLPDTYPTVSAEDLIRRDPEVLLLTSLEKSAALARPGWDRLSAVRNGRVHHLDPDVLVRPTLRSLDGLRQLQALFREATP